MKLTASRPRSTDNHVAYQRTIGSPQKASVHHDVRGEGATGKGCRRHAPGEVVLNVPPRSPTPLPEPKRLRCSASVAVATLTVTVLRSAVPTALEPSETIAAGRAYSTKSGKRPTAGQTRDGFAAQLVSPACKSSINRATNVWTHEE
jgi:hypothetical protein